MQNKMAIALFHSEWGIENDGFLQHYGILGMHWGVRRYQPYGQGGYDPDHEGKNIGLAARLAGHTGSYSDAIKRGSSLGSRAKAAASSLGKRAGSAASEAVERFNYASDRTAQGILNAGRKAKSGLAKYASTDRINGQSIEDESYRNLLERSDFGTLAKGVGIQLKADARRGINGIKHTSFDDVKSALGSGASRFQDAISKTAVKSKEFGRNAAMTAALFGGALDPRSNASQTVTSKYATGGQAETASAFRKDYGATAPGGKYYDLLRGANKGSTSDLRRSNASLIRSAGKSLTPDMSTMSNLRRAQMLGGSVSKLPALSAINQKSSASRWKGNDAANLEARKRVASGDLSLLGVGRYATDSAIKTPYRDTDRRSDKYWEDKQDKYLHYIDTSFDPTDPAVYGSKVGNMTDRQFTRRLERTGIKLSEINQTPASRAVSIGGSASSQELAKRLLGL